MRRFLLLLVAACLVSPFALLKAQITVQESNLLSIFYPGDTLNASILQDSMVNVGKTGGPNVYDFSGLTLVSGGTIPIALGSAILDAASRFPKDTIIAIPNEHTALSFNANGMYDVGKVKTPNDSTVDYVHRSPGATLFRFPVTFGSSYSENITTYDTTYVKGVLTFGSSGTNNWMGVVDGYGTLKLPGGASYPCLRVTKIETNCSTCTDDVNISFLTAGGPFIMVNSDHTQPDTGTIRISNFELLQSRFVTGVQNQMRTPSDFVLDQNYPNPFNPTTRIDFAVPHRGFVTLEVFDVLGRKVATLVNEDLATGSYERTFDANLLPSGVYFDKLVEGNLVKTSKLMFVK